MRFCQLLPCNFPRFLQHQLFSLSAVFFQSSCILNSPISPTLTLFYDFFFVHVMFLFQPLLCKCPQIWVGIFFILCSDISYFCFCFFYKIPPLDIVPLSFSVVQFPSLLDIDLLLTSCKWFCLTSKILLSWMNVFSSCQENFFYFSWVIFIRPS